MKSKRSVSVFLTLLMVFSTIFAAMPGVAYAANTSYYVDSVGGSDSNNGTSTSTAWKTLAKVNSVTFGAGDKIYFKAGCTWSGLLSPKGSGTSASPIIIDKYGTGNLPIINGGGSNVDALYLYNQQYWEINNLEITNTGSSVARRRGVHIVGENSGTLNHIYLTGLKVHGVNGDNKKDDDASAGILVEVKGKTGTVTRFNDVKIDGCTVYDCGRQGIVTWSTWCIISGGYQTRDTAYFDQAAFTNYVVQNCSIYNIDGDGVVPIACKNALVQYNVAHDCNRWYYTNNYYSVAFWPWNSDNTTFQYNEAYLTRNTLDGQGYDCDYWSNGTIMQYNYSHDNVGGFILVCSPGSSYFNTNSIIRYNISQNDATGGGNIFVLNGPGTVGTKIYNNTISIPGGSPATKLFVNSSWGGNSGQTSIENNIFYLAKSIPTDDQSAWTYKNNCYYGVTAPGEDTTAVKADPMLVSPNSASIGRNTADGYKLKAGSPCLGRGILESNNGGKDYWGNAVSSTAVPNIGAYNGAGIATTSPVDTTSYYTIVNRNSGKSLQPASASTADGANIVQMTNSTAASQQWQFIDAGGGYYKIKNRNSGKIMDINGASTADGAANIQWTDNGGNNQQWQLVDAGGGYYKIKNRNSGKILDIKDRSTADGAQDIQWTDNGGTNQMWSFVKQ